MELKYTEKVSRIVLVAIYVALALLLLHYFGNVVSYIILGLLVALISKPLVRLMRKITIHGKSAPDGLLAILAILLIFVIIGGVVSGLVPVFRTVVTNITAFSSGSSVNNLSYYLENLNATLRNTFSLKPDFKLEVLLLDQLSSIFSVNLFGNMIGSVASTFAGIGVALFSAVFIAFFLIKDETLFHRVVALFTPERHSEHATETLIDIEHLLSRYFVGLIIEMSCVGLVDFLGLWIFAKLDIEFALGIGFMAGILNIIPYLGPLIGGVIGSLMAVVVKFCAVGALPGIGLLPFVLILASVFIAAQMVDNVVLQPIIYSTSIQAHPLEIFIVMLLAAEVGGMVGMLMAIPAYTVVRVFAIHFFPDNRIVKALAKRQ